MHQRLGITAMREVIQRGVCLRERRAMNGKSWQHAVLLPWDLPLEPQSGLRETRLVCPHYANLEEGGVDLCKEQGLCVPLFQVF